LAYNFLELVNKVNRRLNEVELTSSNFATAKGFNAHVKDAVNAAIRYINQKEYQWPFNHTTFDETLVLNQTRYAFQSDCKVIDFGSFRIQESTSPSVATKKLDIITYEAYLSTDIKQEYDADNGTNGVPKFVFHGPDLTYGLSPQPDAAYTLTYEYYTFPTDLSASTDAPTIPQRFEHVIIDMAMHYAYMFRSNEQQALVAKERADEGIEDMRSMLINRYYAVESGMIQSSTGSFGITSSILLAN